MGTASGRRAAPTTGEDAAWLRRAVDLAVANVAEDGGPFGAVIVRAGELIGAGGNRVTAELDPSAHAEVVAIRDACRRIGDFTLTGAMLYASCEPCPMCLATTLWARLDRVVFAADRDDAAAAGFDDGRFYRLFEGASRADRSTWPTPVTEHRIPGRTAPFESWLAGPGRTAY